MKFDLKNIKKLINKENMLYGIIFCEIIILLSFLTKKKDEDFENTSDSRMLILVKDNSKDLNHHHLNISKIRVIDYENKEIPLTLHSISDEWKKDDYKSVLDNNPKTFFHSGYTDKHLYYHGTNYQGHLKKSPKWVTFTFPSDKDIKYIHIQSRSGFENRIDNVKLYVYRGKLDKFWEFTKGSSIPIIKDFSKLPETIINVTLKGKIDNYIMSDKLINEKSALAFSNFDKFDENNISNDFDSLKKISNTLNNIYENASNARLWKMEDSPIDNSKDIAESHIILDKNNDKLKRMKMILDKVNKKIKEIEMKSEEVKTTEEETEEIKTESKKKEIKVARLKAKLFLGFIMVLIFGGGIFLFMKIR